MGAVLSLMRPEALPVEARGLPAFRPTGLPLSELRKWFLREFASPLSDATRHNYARTLALACEGSPGWRKYGPVKPLPEHPTPAEVTRWLSEMKTAGYEDTTINLRRTDLVHVYEAGARCTVSQGNPAMVLPWRKSVPKRAPLKDVRGTWAFLRAGALSLRELAFVAVLRFTGLRKGEALGLEWRHIDLEGRTVAVDQQRRKANSRVTTRRLKSEAARRKVPMRAELRDVLRELRQAEGDTLEVRSGRGGGKRTSTALIFPFGEYQLGKVMQVLRGIDPEGFPRADAWHVFRHTCAVELWRAGQSEAFIQEWLGHASLEKTAVYLRSLDGRRIAMADVDALDPEYRPKPPKKKPRKKNESAASVPAPATLPNETAASTAASAVPPEAPDKEAQMTTETGDVKGSPTTTNHTPSGGTELRKLGN